MPDDVADRLEPQLFSIVATHENRERIVEAERLRPFEMKARGVFGFDAPVNLARIGQRRELEYRRQRGAGIFDIRVDLAGHERVVREIAAELEAALDRETGTILDRLRDDLAEDDLLGKVLRADRDRLRRAGMKRDRRDDNNGGNDGAEDSKGVAPVQAPTAAAEAMLDRAEKKIRGEREQRSRHGA